MGAHPFSARRRYAVRANMRGVAKHREAHIVSEPGLVMGWIPMRCWSVAGQLVNIGLHGSPHSGQIVTGFSAESYGSVERNPVVTVAGIGIANDDLSISTAHRPLSR
jgi:hypothetical protein